jgi:hypothetical protein
MAQEMLRGVYPERSEGLSMTVKVFIRTWYHAGTSAIGRTGDPVAPTNFSGVQTNKKR